MSGLALELEEAESSPEQQPKRLHRMSSVRSITDMAAHAVGKANPYAAGMESPRQGGLKKEGKEESPYASPRPLLSDVPGRADDGGDEGVDLEGSFHGGQCRARRFSAAAGAAAAGDDRVGMVPPASWGAGDAVGPSLGWSHGSAAAEGSERSAAGALMPEGGKGGGEHGVVRSPTGILRTPTSILRRASLSITERTTRVKMRWGPACGFRGPF